MDLSDLINLINALAGDPTCEPTGDYLPCDEVTLSEVIDYIVKTVFPICR